MPTFVFLRFAFLPAKTKFLPAKTKFLPAKKNVFFLLAGKADEKFSFTSFTSFTS